MSTPAQQLASFAQTLRARLDAGELPQPRARRALRGAAQRLLTLYPRDEALAAAFDVARRARFVPPAPTELPAGSPLEVWRALETRSPAALEALAATILEPPDPQADPGATDQAARVLELFLAIPSAWERAEALLARLRGRARASAVALWALRIEAGRRTPEELEEPATWDAFLAPLLATAAPAAAGGGAATDEDRWAVATGLRLAASTVIAHAGAPGSQWIVPVLGGRRVANASLALARRPALADDLAPALRWLHQAEALSPGRAEGGLEGLVSAADEADRAGRLSDGTARLLRAMERSGGRGDLADAVAARGLALLEPGLWDRAAEVLTGEPTGLDHGRAPEAPEDDDDRAYLLAARAWRPAPPEVTLLSAPDEGWEERLPGLAAPAPGGDVLGEGDPREAPSSSGGAEGVGSSTTGREGQRAPEELAVLEAAGSVERAARGWLARGDARSLMQAARLAHALGPADRRGLVEALRAAACADEEVLARDPTQRALAAQLLALAPEDREAPLWELRLRAAAAAAAPVAGPAGEAPGGGDGASGDDPHSPASRLGAAADLLAAGNLEAAGAVLGALLRKLDDPALRERLVDLVADLLRREDPPTDFLGQAGRALSAPGPVAEALVERLRRDPEAAYALHDALRRAAERDGPHGDRRRVQLLEAWLGIWRATRTPPALDATRSLMRHAPYRLALAGFRAAGAPDPVTEAVRFVARYPPRHVTAERWADALAAL